MYCNDNVFQKHYFLIRVTRLDKFVLNQKGTCEIRAGEISTNQRCSSKVCSES
jgi:hypothetical protein